MSTVNWFARRIYVTRSRWRVVFVLVAATSTAALSACVGLDVLNPNGLAVDNVYSSAANTEAALVGSWRAYHALLTGTCPTLPMSVHGNDNTQTSITYIDFSAEPRLPINNRDNLNCLTRFGYNNAYEAIAGGRDSYQGIISNKLKFGVVDTVTPNGKDTPSRLIFAKFIIAMGQLNVGLHFDKGYITDFDTPKESTGGALKPYQEVTANAIAQFRGVIADVRATPAFTFPTTWINGRPITSDELIRICLSNITRAEVYMARTPTERAAVNWAAVLARLDSGIVRDFAQQADPAISPTASPYLNNSFAQNTLRISNRLIGPSDTSGVYQTWLATPLAGRAAITVTTPDRRIHGATNTTTGTRFIRQTTSMSSATNGPYLTSQYRSIRYLNTAADSGNRALYLYVSMDEQKYIRAEALWRLSRFAEAAALINPTRVAANLKPVDANGPPAGRDCVPRADDGSCGTLFDAIQYEKRIDLYPYAGSAIAFFDQRAWGKLVSGTPIHWPVVGRELTTMGLPYYTFGGGGPGSAP